MRKVVAALLAGTVVAAGCAAPVGPEVVVGGELPAPGPGDFPGAAALLDGFDAGDGGRAHAADDEWRAGDEVLYGLRLQRDGRVRHWLLHLRVTEPVALLRDRGGRSRGEPMPTVDWLIRVDGEQRTFPTRHCRVLATVCDAEGRVLGRSEPQLPRDFVARGISAACERVWRQRSGDGAVAVAIGPEDVDAFAEGTLCAVALLQVVQADDVLAPLLWEVVDPPSLWSVLGSLGVRVVVRPQFLETVAATSPVPAFPTPSFRVPMSLLVNEREALCVGLTVTRPQSPLGLCGGVLAAEAWHPADHGRRFTLVLLAARRGPAWSAPR